MEFNKKNIRTILLMIFGCILFYLGLKNIGMVLGTLGSLIDLIFPFILGAGIAFVINVPMTRIEYWIFHKAKGRRIQSMKRPLSFFITLLALIGVLIIAIYIVVPQTAQTLQIIARQLPGAIDSLQTWVISKMSYWQLLEDLVGKLSVDWGEIAAKAAAVMQNAATSMVNSGIGAVSNIISALVSLLIGFVFSIYILMSKEKLARQGKQVIWAICPPERAKRILYVCALSQRTFSKFISGQCLEACILGMMFFIAMTIFGMPYAMLISILIAFTALIPMVGAFIGCFLGAFFIMMESPFMALMFILMFLVLQQIEGNLIYPHVVGGSVGLPSIWVLFAITIGGNLMGVMGMILFIPICSVVYALFKIYVKDRLNVRSVPEESWTQPIEISEDVFKSSEDK